MRVRKSGKTELDPRKSFQEYQGERAPWIVISVDDIKKTIMKIPNVRNVRLIFSPPEKYNNNGSRQLPLDLIDPSVETCSAVLVVEKSNSPNGTPNFESFERKENPFKITILNRIRQKWFRLFQKLSQ